MQLLGHQGFQVCVCGCPGHFYRASPAAAGVFFMYDLSPMMVQMTEHRRSLTHFLTGVCAIVGGVFTVAGMLDGMLYHSTRALQKKIDLGKAS